MYLMEPLAMLLRTMAVLSVVFWVFAVTRFARLSRAERARKDKIAVIVYGVQLCLTIVLFTGIAVAHGNISNFINVLFWIVAVLIFLLTLFSLDAADKTSVIGRRIATAAVLWLGTIVLVFGTPTV